MFDSIEDAIETPFHSDHMRAIRWEDLGDFLFPQFDTLADVPEDHEIIRWLRADVQTTNGDVESDTVHAILDVEHGIGLQYIPGSAEITPIHKDPFRAVRYASRYGDVDYTTGIGEPGYSDPERGIITADWNYFSDCYVRFIESLGYFIGWRDEWVIDHNEQNAYRTSPDSYSWSPSFWLWEGEVIGRETILNNERVRGDYVKHHMNNPNTALQITDFDLSKFGFKQYNGQFRNGMHRGMNDNPKEITEEIRDEHPNADVVFTIDSPSQFHVNFSTYYRTPNE